MPDRGKVIEALEHCTRKNEPRCAGCPYFSECAKELLAVERDALELLRGQEPVEPKEYMSRVNRTEYLCGACDSGILFGDEFCRHCGREVKWDAAD